MKNKGISLITLVITIIIMIILAGAIILTLTNSGIFDKANETVGKYNLKEVQAMADLAWAEAYADGARDKDTLQAAVDKALEDNDLDDKYKAVADEKGVTVTEKVQGGNTGVVPDVWQENVSAVTADNVPIPKGFVASPYDGTDGMPAENTKAGGLVIYALTETEITEGKTDILSIDGKNGELTLKEAHYASMETRNQFVWVPVDKNNFANEFVRDDFGSDDLSSAVGSGYWELALKDGNTPSDTQKSSYVSDATLTEAKAMYASVKEYGGFYIARYEVGYSYNAQNNKVLSITMGKYPYNWAMWSGSMKETANDGGAVALSREFYPNDSTNTTGVVSTLTYGVQWDVTLNWWTGKDLTDSTSYGNYYTTSIDKNEYNKNAQYSANNGSSWKDAVAKGSERWLLTTGAFKNANVNNIYDMAGNLFEWTMEGYSSNGRIYRGGCFENDGDYCSVICRSYTNWSYQFNYAGFRPSLYIKSSTTHLRLKFKPFTKMECVKLTV